MDWSITATTGDITSLEGILRITFLKEEGKEIETLTEPPYLVDNIQSPPTIPCLDNEDETDHWKFTLPQAVSETGIVKIKLDCETLKELFAEKIEDDTLELLLESTDNQYAFGTHSCKVILSNQFEQESQYTV